MALQFNLGEVTARLRRALGTRGRTPYGLDETCVPVVTVLDAGEAPYRLDGKRWFISITVPAVAAQFGRMEIGNTTERDMILDWIDNWTTTAGLSVNLGIAATIQRVTANHAGADFYTTEGLPKAYQNAYTQLGPSYFVTSGAAVLSIPLVNMPPQSAQVPSRRYDVGMVIPAGKVLVLEGNIVNAAFSLNLSGRQFDGLENV